MEWAPSVSWCSTCSFNQSIKTRDAQASLGYPRQMPPLWWSPIDSCPRYNSKIVTETMIEVTLIKDYRNQLKDLSYCLWSTACSLRSLMFFEEAYGKQWRYTRQVWLSTYISAIRLQCKWGIFEYWALNFAGNRRSKLKKDINGRLVLATIDWKKAVQIFGTSICVYMCAKS